MNKERFLELFSRPLNQEYEMIFLDFKNGIGSYDKHFPPHQTVIRIYVVERLSSEIQLFQALHRRFHYEELCNLKKKA